MGLADRAGLNLRTVERIENGEVANPRRSTLKVIEIALDREAAA
jgi:transcriptional regulator with XRE-family HTH domain